MAPLLDLRKHGVGVALAVVASAAISLSTSAANLYGSDSAGNLTLINTTTGAGTFIGTEPGFPLSTEIVYDLATGTLYSEEHSGGPNLHTLSQATGFSTGFVSHLPGSINGLEYVGGTLYGTYIPGSGAASTLFIVNPSTGVLTPIGPTGFGPISGLAYDTPNTTMYGVIGGGAPAIMLTINLATGAATPGPALIDIGTGNPITHVGSIEYASDGKLYGATGNNSNMNPGWLFSVNPLSGACAFIGPTGLQGITGLANPTSPTPSVTLLGSDNSGNLFRINTTTGAGALIGTEGQFPLSTEIEYDLASGTLYSEEAFFGSNLHTINPNTGLSTGFVMHTPPGAINGMEFVGGQLYGTHIPGSLAPSTLGTINPASGVVTIIGPTGTGPITGLAEDVSTGTVYGVTGGGQPAVLVTMNLGTGVAIPGPVLFDVATGNQLVHVGSIEYDANGVLYGGMGNNGNMNPGWLFWINPLSGGCTFIGPTGFQGITGLTSDLPPNVVELIGSDSFGNLFRINVANGAAGIIGTDPTFPLSTEIEVDPANGILYSEEFGGGGNIHFMNAHNGVSFKFVNHIPGMFNGMEYIGGQLYGTHIPGPLAPSTLEILDPVLGGTLTVGPTGFGPISGLAEDVTTGTVYGVTAGGQPANLVTINLGTGAATIGPMLIDSGSGVQLAHVGSIEYASNGVLYGGMGNNGNINPGWLFSINPATGACTFIGNTQFSGITGLADPTSVCTGDANGDKLVDVNDISYVLFRLPTNPCPGPPGCPGDVNLDGFVDVNDISYVLFRLGKHCP